MGDKRFVIGGLLRLNKTGWSKWLPLSCWLLSEWGCRLGGESSAGFGDRRGSEGFVLEAAASLGRLIALSRRLTDHRQWRASSSGERVVG